ncbi:hypothetical protein GYMLUDRAFT_493704 [Collybiopsis luxurians FD-317 M1]|uniref:Unplaced genomic scaffold GYMLUscaffold_181, whole genome shotgun sequence n=1 Tax=Collybiopsis luxurians FD-317 M1 TaxID=944289 RepID=A0A0D0C5Y6_9AGAR|nr:hypothetical protein GYMLUDRAFT_493704 [Collybiopsis luxurians FD-317 M1]
MRFGDVWGYSKTRVQLLPNSRVFYRLFFFFLALWQNVLLNSCLFAFVRTFLFEDILASFSKSGHVQEVRTE